MANKTNKNRKKAKSSTRSKAPVKEEKVLDSGIPMANEIQMIASIGIMLIMMLSNFGLCGYMGKALSSFFFGIFGIVQYVMPLAFCLGVFILIANDYSLLSIKKCTAGFITLIMISAVAQIIYQGDPVKSSELFSQAIEDHRAGGILGGGFALILKNGFGTVGAMVIILCCLLLSLIMLTQRSFVGFFQNNVTRGTKFMDKIKENQKLTREHRQEERALRAEEALEAGEMDDGASRISSFFKGKSEKNRVESEESTGPDLAKKVEEKLKELEENRSKKAKKRSAQSAKDRLTKEADTQRTVPVFTSSEEVKKKDSVQELHPEIYPVTAEDGKTKAFEGKLDFSAFSFNSGKSPEEFAEDMSRDSEEIMSFLNSLEEYVPPYRSSGGAKVSELKATESSGEGGEEDASAKDPKVINVKIADAGQSRIRPGRPEMIDVELSEEKLSTTATAAPKEGTDLIEPDGVEERFAAADSAVAGARQSKNNGDMPYTSSARGAGDMSAVKSAETAGDMSVVKSVESAGDMSVVKSAESAGDMSRAKSAEVIADSSKKQVESVEASPRKKATGDDYIFPPMSLLSIDENIRSASFERELQETAKKLQDTLKSFGVNVTITEISCGPAVTRYELFPEQGTKVSKIVSLTDDIKLNLAAPDIRIEAPIPGKAAVGIEVPNKQTMKVHLRELIDSRLFRNFKSRLAFAVGKDIGGNIVVTDLAKMPHLLIAGATGSGKSVCINTLIMSLLYKANPEEVKMIMIDPKMVELNVYNGIPHLLIPVVTDPKKASGALNWAVAEMTDRYKKFAETNVRNLEGYNKKVDRLIASGEVDAEKLKPMPQIVIIIDELADLMMVAPGEVEDAIVRLSQLARAAGIHLVIATQRPSVNVITGLIKANVPSRIAFSVSSGVDSRTIIDMNGAEKLLGKGDMLFYPSGYQKPVRVQGALVEDAEVAKVVDFIKENQTVEVQADEVSNIIEKKIEIGSNSSDKDEYFEAAARFIMEKDKATIGMLQRMFKIGFNRAARIMDQLADAGIVGPEEGTKPRQILMTPEQLDEYLEEYI